MARVSLYCLLARDNPVAVIFRRGPSKQVATIHWDMRSDVFRVGQWLKGRIYERRCDLSPSGNLLAYFAATYKPPFRTWTAVSRPPFLTALALWPKGDAWGGGALFASEREIHLNHRDDETASPDSAQPPALLRVRPLGANPGWGEDDPIGSMRLERDGWCRTQEGVQHTHHFGASPWIEYDPAILWKKSGPGGSSAWRLMSALTGIKIAGGPWYAMSHSLQHENGSRVELPDCEWADWCSKGDAVFSVGGALYRMTPRLGSTVTDARLLQDFTNLSFTELEAPEEALTWDRSLPRSFTQAV